MVEAYSRPMLNKVDTPSLQETSGEIWSRRLFCLIICFSEVLAVVNNTIRSVIPNTMKLDTAIMYGIYFFVIAKAAVYIFRRLRLFDIFFVFGLLLGSVVSLFVGYNEHLLPEVMPRLLLFCVPVYLSAVTVKNTEKLREMLYKTGYVLLICSALSLFVFKLYTVSADDHSLSAGYNFATAIIMIIAFHRSKLDYISFFIALVMLLSVGSRGPFLTVVAFIALYIFVRLPKGNRRMAFFVIAACACFFLWVFWETILLSLISVIHSWGLSTRVLESLLDADIVMDDNRNALQKFAIDYIKERIFYGSGPLNDRQVISSSSYMIYGENYSSSYVHNIFLEIMMQFGAVVGGIMSLFLIINPIRVLTSKVTEDKLLILFAMGCGLFPLLVSFSYITYTGFYLFFGLLLNILRTEKRNGPAKTT